VIVETTPKFNILCHCEDCRRCNGTAFSTQFNVPKTSVNIEGSYKIFDVTVPNGNVVKRWFCTGCGSQLMHYSPAMGDQMGVQTGNFDAFINLPIKVEVFTKDRWKDVKPVEEAMQFERLP